MKLSKNIVLILLICIFLILVVGCDNEQYTLILEKKGPGTINPEPGEYTYDEVTTKTLEANPDEKAEFVNWDGEVADKEQRKTEVKIDKDLTVTGKFSEVPEVKLKIEAEGLGKVEPKEGEHVFDKGEVVDLKAKPEGEDIKFNHWEGEVGNKSSEETNIELNESETVTAYFSELTYPQVTPETLEIKGEKDLEAEIEWNDAEKKIEKITQDGEELNKNKEYLLENDTLIFKYDDYLKEQEGDFLLNIEFDIENVEIEIEDNRESNEVSEDLIIEEEHVLKENTTIDGDLFLQDGRLDLNGYNLVVRGKIVHSDGIMDVNDGEISVGRDYLVQKRYNENDFGSGYGKLIMNSPEDYIKVNGDFVFQTYARDSDLSHGEIEVKGDFKQLGGYVDNFQPQEKHTVVFSGDTEQKIYFERPDISNFQCVEFENENITMDSDLDINELKSDGVLQNPETYTLRGVNLNGNKLVVIGDLRLEGDMNFSNGEFYIEGDLYHEWGNIDVEGGKISIEGNLTQYGWTNMYLHGGRMVVQGNYRIQKIKDGEEINYSESDGNLIMTSKDDYVLVEGDFYTQSKLSHSGLQKGILELKGDFNQIEGDPENFQSQQSHKVIFSGNESQSIYFESPEKSGFKNVVFKNSNIKIKSDLSIDKLEKTAGEINLEVPDEITFYGFDFDGNTVKFSDNLKKLVKNGHTGMNLNGGRIILPEGVDLYQEQGDIIFEGSDINLGNIYKNASDLYELYFGDAEINVAGEILQRKGGSITFDNLEINVDGNIVTSNEIELKSGVRMKVGGDLRFQTVVDVENEDNTYEAADGGLKMSSSDDFVLVEGDFINQSEKEYDYSKGKFELRGDFIQLEGKPGNFNARKDHLMVFSGDDLQTIEFDSPEDSGFAKVEFENTDIRLENDLRIDEIVQSEGNIYFDVPDEIALFEFNFNGNSVKFSDNLKKLTKHGNKTWEFNDEGLVLPENIDLYQEQGDIILGSNNLNLGNLYNNSTSSDLLLKNAEIDIGGELIQRAEGSIILDDVDFNVNEKVMSSGEIKLKNGSRMEVSGDLRFLKENEGDYESASGGLMMSSSDDFVLVEGDFINHSEKEYEISAGEMELKGDFYQSEGKPGNFETTGDHLMTFSGEDTQTIDFASPEVSGFAKVDFKNTDIKLESGLRLDKIETTGGNISFEVPDEFTFYGFDFNGATVELSDNLQKLTKRSETTMNLNGGELLIPSGTDFHHLEGEVIFEGVDLKLGKLYKNTESSFGKTLSFKNVNLDVEEELIQDNEIGTINIENSKINVGENLRSNAFIKLDSSTELIVKNDFLLQDDDEEDSRAMLDMTAEDYLLVEGDFVTQSTYTPTSKYSLPNGIIELKGDFKQLKGEAGNFLVHKEHLMVFSGEEPQNIYFEAPEQSGFSKVKFENTDIHLESDLRFDKIEEARDEISFEVPNRITFYGFDFNGYSVKFSDNLKQLTKRGSKAMNLNGGEFIVPPDTDFYQRGEGDVILDGNDLKLGNLHREYDDLNNNTLFIDGVNVDLEGELTQKGDRSAIEINDGTLNVNDNLESSGDIELSSGSELRVEKDFYLQKNEEEYESNEDNKGCSGKIIMNSDNDYIFIGGNLTLQGKNEDNNALSEGMIELKGDFEQLEGNPGNFNPQQEHVMVFSGEEQQSIYFDTPEESGFSKVDFENTDIKLESGLRLDKIEKADGDINFEVPDEITFYGFDINGYSVELSENLEVLRKSGDVAMDLNGGQLEIPDGINFIQDQGDVILKGTEMVLGKLQKNPSYSSQKLKIDKTRLWVEELIQKYGEIELNNAFTEVEKQLVSNGDISLDNDSTLEVNENLRMQSIVEEEDEILYDSGSGKLSMESEGDYILVEGDLIYQSDDYPFLDAGELEIKGDLKKLESESGFGSRGDNLIHFSGDDTQSIYLHPQEISVIERAMFDCPSIKIESDVGFRKLEGEIVFENPEKHEIYGLKDIEDNLKIEGDLVLSGDKIDLEGINLITTGDFQQSTGLILDKGSKLNVAGNYLIDGFLTLNEGEVNIDGDLKSGDISLQEGYIDLKGNYYFSDGGITIGKGSMIVGEDMRLQSVAEERENGFGPSQSYIYMDLEESYLLVEGDFVVQTEDEQYLLGGLLEIQGDFIQYDNKAQDDSFSPLHDHKVVLSGGKEQIVHFDSPEESRFKNLYVVNNEDDRVFFETDYSAENEYSVGIDSASPVELQIGQSKKISAEIEKSSVRLESLDPEIVTINNNQVKGEAPGVTLVKISNIRNDDEFIYLLVKVVE
ncbi:MAG: InlB B-repeat-containing protein [archaeon]